MKNFLKNLNIRRIFARWLLVQFTLWAIFTPQQSYAFVPAAIGAYGLPSVAAAAGAAGGGGAAVVAGAVDLVGGAAGGGIAAIGVGAVIGYLAVDYLFGGQTNTVRIPLTNDPAKAVPPPSALPTSNPVNGFTDASTAACDAYAAANPSVVALYQSSGNAPRYLDPVSYGFPATSTHAVYYCSYTGVITKGVATVSCGSGYIASGSTCVLSDARAATPDKACDFQRSGSALSMISDPDCAASGQALPAICDGVTFICSGQGFKNGQPVQYSVQPRPDGGSNVTVQTQATVGNQTQVNTTTIGVNQSGVVDAVQGQVSAGSIPATSTGAATTPSTTNAPLVQPQTQTANTNPVVFPTDYARTGEASSAADKIVTSIGTFTTPLASDPLAPLDTRTQNLSSPVALPTINWMPSLLPGNAVLCSAMPIDGGVHGGLLNLNGTASLDICDKLDIIRQILGYLFMISTVVYIYRRFTGANSGQA